MTTPFWRDKSISFLALTLAWSWTVWGIALLFGWRMTDPTGLAAFAIGGLGPGAVALTFVLRGPGSDRRDFLWRLLDPRPISLGDWLVILLPVPIAAGLGVVAGWAWTGEWPTLTAARAYLSAPGLLTSFVLTTLLFGPLPEEIGWRGVGLVALDRVLARRWAAPVLAGFWVIWHLPLFFLRESPFAAAYPVGSVGFWFWGLGLFGASLWMSWVYDRAKGSILAAILCHFVLNATSGLLALPEVFQLAFLIFVAVFGILCWFIGRARS